MIHRTGETARALAVVACTVVLASFAVPSAHAQDRARGQDRRHAHAIAVLAAVQAAFTPAPTSRQAGPLPRKDVTVLLRQLRVARADLTPAEQQTADEYLRTAGAASCEPPFLSGQKVLASAHFCIRYYVSGVDATTYAWAHQNASTLENVWKKEVAVLGFRRPLDDGDGRLDVTLRQLGDDGIYGFCATDTAAAQSSASCELDNDFSAAEFGAPPLESLRVTAAHEFFHAIQFGYDATEAAWALEGSAVWAEDQVYPGINDYLQYLRFSGIQQPATPLDNGGPFERYGATIFFKFLAEYLGSPVVVRRVWEYADAARSNRNVLSAAVAYLFNRGKQWPPMFARYAAWNTLPAGSYDDRAAFPRPRWSSFDTLGRDGTRRRTASLDHLASSPHAFLPGSSVPGGSKLQITVNGPWGFTTPQALAQVRLRNGSVAYRTVPLNSAGNGSLVVGFDRGSVASVVVTLSNASVHGYDNQPFAMTVKVI